MHLGKAIVRGMPGAISQVCAIAFRAVRLEQAQRVELRLTDEATHRDAGIRRRRQREAAMPERQPA